jgi:hypothetical protein
MLVRVGNSTPRSIMGGSQGMWDAHQGIISVSSYLPLYPTMDKLKIHRTTNFRQKTGLLPILFG